MTNQKISILFAIAWLPMCTLSGQQAHNHNNHQNNYDSDMERWYWQMPLRVMDALTIKKGMTIADVGAGSGYFTFYLSDRVGETGKVIASDIDANALESIQNRCIEKNINNISVINGIDDDPRLPEESADLILIVNTIHLVNNPTVFLKNTIKGMKPGGSLVIIQWDADKMKNESMPWDPQDQARYTLRTNLRKIYDANLEVVQLMNFLPRQTIYICQPKVG